MKRLLTVWATLLIAAAPVAALVAAHIRLQNHLANISEIASKIRFVVLPRSVLIRWVRRRLSTVRIWSIAATPGLP